MAITTRSQTLSTRTKSSTSSRTPSIKTIANANNLYFAPINQIVLIHAQTRIVLRNSHHPKQTRVLHVREQSLLNLIQPIRV